MFRKSGLNKKELSKNSGEFNVEITYLENSQSLLKIVLGKSESPMLNEGESLLITMRIDKKLMNFEEYPNDV